MKQTPAISIIVLNYNTSDLLGGALESIAATTGNLPVETVVIDNASTDGGFSHLAQKFEHDPRFKFVQNKKNTGLAAVNSMLETTKGKYIMTMDADARLHAHTLQLLAGFLDATPGAGAATANLLNPDGSQQRYFRRLMTPFTGFFSTVLGRAIDKYLLNLRYYKRYHYEGTELVGVTEIEQPSVTCLMLRRGAFGSYIIDPETPFYFTDVGLCKRIYERGYRIYLLPDASTTHFKSTSFNKMKNKWRTREYYRSLMVYFRKHYPLHAPMMWLVLWLDRIMRYTLLYTTGREPMR